MIFKGEKVWEYIGDQTTLRYVVAEKLPHSFLSLRGRKFEYSKNSVETQPISDYIKTSLQQSKPNSNFFVVSNNDYDKVAPEKSIIYSNGYPQITGFDKAGSSAADNTDLDKIL